jgi:hypothetical protein
MISLAHLTKFQKRLLAVFLACIGVSIFFYTLFLVALLQIAGIYIIRLDIMFIIIPMAASIFITGIVGMIFAVSRLRSMFREQKEQRNEQRQGV